MSKFSDMREINPESKVLKQIVVYSVCSSSNFSSLLLEINFFLGYIFQVAYLQAQLMQVKAQLAQSFINSSNSYNPQWSNNNMASISGLMTSSFPANNPTYNNVKSNSSPQSSLESADNCTDIGMNIQDIQSLDQLLYQTYTSRNIGF